MVSRSAEIDHNVPLITEILVQKATPEEEAEHEACLDDIGRKLKEPVIWRRQSS